MPERMPQSLPENMPDHISCQIECQIECPHMTVISCDLYNLYTLNKYVRIVCQKNVRIMCWVGDHLKKIDFVLWCFSYFVPSFFCFFASPLLCFVFPCVFGFPHIFFQAVFPYQHIKFPKHLLSRLANETTNL